MKTITLGTKITLAVVGLSVLTTILYATNPISFSTINQPIGVSAAPADLIATELCTQNLDTIACMGNVSVLATIPGPLGPCLERYTAMAPLQSASATPAPFIPRDIFVTQGAQVYQIRPPNLPMLFTTIPDSGCAVDRTGITFDHVGTFGYNMIVTCLGGGIWEVDGTGTPTQIADTGMTTEGPAVVPLSFGPPPGAGRYGGQILVADDADGQINAIASDGTVTYDVFDWTGAEGVVVIPSAPCTYCSGGAFFQAIENFDAIYQYPPTDFTGLGGGILVTSEAGAGAAAITWDDTNQLYDITFFDNIPGGAYQGASFVDCDVPTPTPTPTATAAATATATFTPTPTATATNTPTPTPTPTATSTPTPTPTATATPTPTLIPVCQIPTSIRSNFNGTAINAGNWIWFTSVLDPSDLPANQPVTIHVTNQSITSSAFTLSVGDATVIFDPNATVATTTFAGGMPTTTLPSFGLKGNTLFSALSYLVPANIPGGVHNISWSGTISSDTPGISIKWKWAAAVYTNFSSNYTLLGVKPVDDDGASIYHNADHAGTPENFKQFVIGGATGGGGANYTGGLSSTAIVRCPP